MSAARVAITIERDLMVQLGRPVKNRRFPNRSRAVPEAVTEKPVRIERSRLAHECEKFDRSSAQAMAEEGMSEEAAEWPEHGEVVLPWPT